MTVKARPVKLGHPNKFLGQTEAFGDSDRGIRYFARKGCKRVDGNALLSYDDEPVNVHYENFLRHGFIARNGFKESRHGRVSSYTASQLRHFWTRRGHYEIKPSIERAEIAFGLGMDYEFEIKCRMSLRVAVTFRHQVDQLEAKYPGRRVIVKVYNNRPGKAMWLKPFHEAGFPTLITTHVPFKATPAAAEPYCDEYRRFKPRWVA